MVLSNTGIRPGSQDDIAIGIRLEISDFVNQLNAAKQKAKETIKEIEGKRTGRNSAQIALFERGANYKKLSSTLDESRKSVAAFEQAIYKKRMEMKEVLQTQRPFQGWAMSIMFFGMALQRIFTQVWVQGNKVFQEISHSVEGTVTGFDLLEGSLKYLGFQVGAALEPLAMALIPFIDQLSDIAQKNPELVKDFTKWGIILGGLFAVGGAGVLALNGFLDLGSKISVATKGVLGLKEQMGALVAVGYTVDVALDIADKDYSGAIASALQSGGVLTALAGKTKAGMVLFGIGTVIDIIGATIDGKEMSAKGLANVLAKAAPGLFFISPAAGAAALTATLIFNSKIGDDLIETLGYVFGLVLKGIAEVVSYLGNAFINAFVNPVIRLGRALASIANFFGANITLPQEIKIDLAKSLGIDDRLAEFREVLGWSYKTPTQGAPSQPYAYDNRAFMNPQSQAVVNVYLDSQKIADPVARAYMEYSQ